jgi:hypothetical protein
MLQVQNLVAQGLCTPVLRYITEIKIKSQHNKLDTIPKSHNLTAVINVIL